MFFDSPEWEILQRARSNPDLSSFGPEVRHVAISGQMPRDLRRTQQPTKIRLVGIAVDGQPVLDCFRNRGQVLLVGNGLADIGVHS